MLFYLNEFCILLEDIFFFWNFYDVVDRGSNMKIVRFWGEVDLYSYDEVVGSLESEIYRFL